MNNRCTVLIDTHNWRLACADSDTTELRFIDVDDDASLEARALATAARIDELEGERAIVLAISSRDCLCARIDSEDLSRSGRRQAMAYRLEEHVPISAEQLVADYVISPSGTLGVCAIVDQLQPIIDALEAAGLEVRHVCPAALLAGAQLVAQYPQADAVLIHSKPSEGEEQHDLLLLSNGRVHTWRWFSDRGSLRESIELEVAMIDEPGDVSWLAVGEIPDIGIFEPTVVEDQTMESLAARMSARLLAGESPAWVDLRRDALTSTQAYERYQKPIGALVLSAAVMLVCVAGALYWRGVQFSEIAASMQAEQVQVFKQAFPDQRVPSGSVLSRMRSELRRLEGMSGQASLSSDPSDPLESLSALSQLHALLTALPADARYQVSNLTIQPQRVRFEGVAESHVVAERLAGAIRETGLYGVDPPSSRALGSFGVSYRFTAEPQWFVDADKQSDASGSEALP